MKTRESGFTLLEVLLALFLLMFILVSVVPLFLFATKMTRVSADLGTVGAQAVAEMESLRKQAFSNLTVGGSLSSNVSGYSDVTDPSVTIRWRIVDTSNPTVKTITVSATANRVVAGQAKAFTLVTRRAKP